MEEPEREEFLVKFETAIGAAMRRVLDVNDLYGSRVLREVVLDEMNGLVRFVRRCVAPEVPPEAEGV